VKRYGLLSLFLVLTACYEAKIELIAGRLDVNELRAARGRDTYAAYCAPCHGETGAGDGRYVAFSLEPKPPDFGDISFQTERDDKKLRRAIVEGSEAVGGSNLCPPWGRTLKPEQVNNLIHVIRGLARHPGIGLRRTATSGQDPSER